VLPAPPGLRLFDDLALVSASAPAQTLTRPPTLARQVEPALPDAGVTTPGTAVMEVDVGPDGKVLEVKVVSGVSPGLDAAAVAALRQFEFTPAELDAGLQKLNLQGVLRTAGTREPLAGASPSSSPRRGTSASRPPRRCARTSAPRWSTS
jgi:TonB family protein